MISLFTVRGLAVGANFVAMLGIGAIMGAEGYGQFVFAWSIALTGAAIVSLGTPLWLLKDLALVGPEGPMAISTAAALTLVIPALLITVLFSVCFLVFETIPSVASASSSTLAVSVALLAFLVHLSASLASVLHALDFIGLSMFVRDAVPQGVALAVALSLWMLGQVTPLSLIVGTGLGLFILCAGLSVFVLIAALRSGVFAVAGRSGTYRPSFWGGAVTGTAWAQIDLLIGGLFLGPAELGAYNIVRRCCNLVTLPLSVSSWLTVGHFARAFRAGAQAELAGLVRRALLVALVPGAFLLALVLVAVQPITVRFALPDGLAPLWALLLGQAVLVLLFAPTLTMANTSGLEWSVVTARLIGIGVYGALLLPLVAHLEPLSANALALLGGTLGLHLWAWARVRARWDLNASVLHLVRS